MKIAVAKETRNEERRVSVIPEIAHRLIELGVKVVVEKHAGKGAGFKDNDYLACGAAIAEDKAELYRAADIVTWVKRPPQDLERSLSIPAGAAIVGFLDATKSGDHLLYYARKGFTAFSWDLLPYNRQTKHMHASSAMGAYAGRIACLEALKTVSLTKSLSDNLSVLVIGSGNAGMAAAETVRQRGDRVIVASTRVDSRWHIERTLSGVFVSLPNDPVQSSSSIERQQQKRLIEVISVYEPDIIICSARRLGQKPPKLIAEAAFDVMKPGTLIEDLVATRGGNTVFSERDSEVRVKNGIIIRNKSNYPSQEPEGASTCYSRCLWHLLERVITRSRSQPDHELIEDPLLKPAVATHRGRLSPIILQLRD
jgi:NAD/NADP transhydrogenase alpha subunit